MCVNCMNCTIALHQRYRFEIIENAIRKFNNFFFENSNLSLIRTNSSRFIVVYSLIENFIDFSINHSFDKNILLLKTL